MPHAQCFISAITYVVMESLQTLACASFLEHSIVGVQIPHNDIPGSLESWIRSWAKCIGVEPQDCAVEMVRECVERGWSCRLRVPRAFTKEVLMLCETLDICTVTSTCDESGLRDMTISTQVGWALRVKDFVAVRRKVRREKTRQRDFERRYVVLKYDVTEIMRHIRRCEVWEDSLEYILWGQIREQIESLPPWMQKQCVSRLVEDGVLDEFEL